MGERTLPNPANELPYNHAFNALNNLLQGLICTSAAYMGCNQREEIETEIEDLTPNFIEMDMAANGPEEVIHSLEELKGVLVAMIDKGIADVRTSQQIELPPDMAEQYETTSEKWDS